MKVIDASEKIEPGQREPGTKVKVGSSLGDPALSVEQQGGWESVGVNWGNTPVKTADGSAVPNTTLASVAPQVAPKTPSPNGFAAEDAKDDSAANSEQVNTGMDESRNTPSTSAMEPPKGEQSKLGSSEEQQAAIANQGKREEQKRLDEAEQQRKETGFKQQSLPFGKMVKVE